MYFASQLRLLDQPHVHVLRQLSLYGCTCAAGMSTMLVHQPCSSELPQFWHVCVLAGKHNSGQLEHDALQTTPALHAVWLQTSMLQVLFTLVQVEKAKSQAAEQACRTAQEDAKQSAKQLNQVKSTAYMHAHIEVLSVVSTSHHLACMHLSVS